MQSTLAENRLSVAGSHHSARDKAMLPHQMIIKRLLFQSIHIVPRTSNKLRDEIGASRSGCTAASPLGFDLAFVLDKLMFPYL